MFTNRFNRRRLFLQRKSFAESTITLYAHPRAALPLLIWGSIEASDNDDGDNEDDLINVCRTRESWLELLLLLLLSVNLRGFFLVVQNVIANIIYYAIILLQVVSIQRILFSSSSCCSLNVRVACTRDRILWFRAGRVLPVYFYNHLTFFTIRLPTTFDDTSKADIA